MLESGQDRATTHSVRTYVTFTISNSQYPWYQTRSNSPGQSKPWNLTRLAGRQLGANTRRMTIHSLHKQSSNSAENWSGEIVTYSGETKRCSRGKDQSGVQNWRPLCRGTRDSGLGTSSKNHRTSISSLFRFWKALYYVGLAP